MREVNRLRRLPLRKEVISLAWEDLRRDVSGLAGALVPCLQEKARRHCRHYELDTHSDLESAIQKNMQAILPSKPASL